MLILPTGCFVSTWPVCWLALIEKYRKGLFSCCNSVADQMEMVDTYLLKKRRARQVHFDVFFFIFFYYVLRLDGRHKSASYSTQGSDTTKQEKRGKINYSWLSSHDPGGGSFWENSASLSHGHLRQTRHTNIQKEKLLCFSSSSCYKRKCQPGSWVTDLIKPLVQRVNRSIVRIQDG